MSLKAELKKAIAMALEINRWKVYNILDQIQEENLEVDFRYELESLFTGKNRHELEAYLRMNLDGLDRHGFELSQLYERITGKKWESSE